MQQMVYLHNLHSKVSHLLRTSNADLSLLRPRDIEQIKTDRYRISRDARVFPEILSHLLSQNVASHYSVQSIETMYT